MCKLQISNVHVYWRLDYQAVYRVLTDELADLDEFARQVQRYLAESDERA